MISDDLAEVAAAPAACVAAGCFAPTICSFPREVGFVFDSRPSDRHSAGFRQARMA
jgi:hypothetical protein